MFKIVFIEIEHFLYVNAEKLMKYSDLYCKWNYLIKKWLHILRKVCLILVGKLQVYPLETDQ